MFSLNFSHSISTLHFPFGISIECNPQLLGKQSSPALFDLFTDLQTSRFCPACFFRATPAQNFQINDITLPFVPLHTCALNNLYISHLSPPKYNSSMWCPPCYPDSVNFSMSCFMKTFLPTDISSSIRIKSPKELNLSLRSLPQRHPSCRRY